MQWTIEKILCNNRTDTLLFLFNLLFDSTVFSIAESTMGLMFVLILLVLYPICSEEWNKLEGDCRGWCIIWGGLVFGIGEFNICWYDCDFFAISALPLPSESLWTGRGRWYLNLCRSSFSRSLKSWSLLFNSSYS